MLLNAKFGSLLVLLGACTVEDSTSSTEVGEQPIEATSIHWIQTVSENDDWGRAVLVFSNEMRNCDVFPNRAPGLGALWRDNPIQGNGTGTLLWLQWFDLDRTINSWEGRFVFGEAPIGDRTQRRAVHIPFTRGVPRFDQTGRHGSIRIAETDGHHVSGTIESDQLTGSFLAQICGLD